VTVISERTLDKYSGVTYLGDTLGERIFNTVDCWVKEIHREKVLGEVIWRSASLKV
jgi:hypothetical protein